MARSAKSGVPRSFIFLTNFASVTVRVAVLLVIPGSVTVMVSPKLNPAPSSVIANVGLPLESVVAEKDI